MIIKDDALQLAPLGKKSPLGTSYQPDLLFPIARQVNRERLGIHGELPFTGCDIWNGYELSWLNTKGKPIVAAADFVFPCESPNLVESKSFKLYLNSLSHSRFDSMEHVQHTVQQDLSLATDAVVNINTYPLSQLAKPLTFFSGLCLDDLDISCDTYTPHPSYLLTEDISVTETLYSDLLKSNCPVTGQPDWASVQIHYSGKKIQHSGLLKYIVSLRDHSEFHEQCVERMFMDIMHHCQPEKLLVYARYTRRGGLDINPYRANYAVTDEIANLRLVRQ